MVGGHSWLANRIGYPPEQLCEQIPAAKQPKSTQCAKNVIHSAAAKVSRSLSLQRSVYPRLNLQESHTTRREGCTCAFAYTLPRALAASCPTASIVRIVQLLPDTDVRPRGCSPGANHRSRDVPHNELGATSKLIIAHARVLYCNVCASSTGSMATERARGALATKYRRSVPAAPSLQQTRAII